jgi:hypothetical protein
MSRGQLPGGVIGTGAGDNSSIHSLVAMTIALLLALAGSLGLMAFIVKKLEKAA